MRSASAFASGRRKFAKLDNDFSLSISWGYSSLHVDVPFDGDVLLLILQGDVSLMGESS